RARAPSRRRRGGGDGVRVAGRGPARGAVGARARLSGRAGDHHPERAHLRSHQPRDRPPLHVARSAHLAATAMTAIETSGEPIAHAPPRLLPAMMASPKALIGLAIIAVIVACALASPLLAPYDPNVQSLVGRLQHPLTTAANGQFHLFGTDHL